MKVILTGATGMVGEGVLLECLANPEIGKVLLATRRHYDCVHPKLEELLVPDFFNLDGMERKLAGYDACFFCSGVSSVGMKEPEYRRVTYDLTLSFATVLAKVNPGMAFIYVSGAATDSSENGKLMWARVKGKTENDLMRLPFGKVYNFRPGFMKPTPGQKSIKRTYRILAVLSPLLQLLMPGQVLTLGQVGKAMINGVRTDAPAGVKEIRDIRALADA
jgi:uncharacterized protein YbjT (DUF2867 family)